ncbi:unnamed protein product [Closterium sp. NIES-53]
MADVFRSLNPGAREFTFYTRATQSSSKIDRILVSAELLPAVVEASHSRSLKGLSDHKCGVKTVLQANLRLHMGPGIWRLPAADTAKPGVEKIIKAVTEKHREGGSRNFGLLLTRLKAALRRYAAEERKRVHATLRHLELAVFELQQELMREPHRDDLRVSLAEKESQLGAYLRGENERLHLLAGVKEQTKGEIASKVLSGKVKTKKSRTMITVLELQGAEQRGTREILEAASSFYSSLFTEAPPTDLPCWTPDLRKTLSRGEKVELDAEWSEDEVKQALKDMAGDKSPGNDGLPKELFERHWDLLRGDFMGFVKQFEESAVLPEEVQAAVTILLHKKGPREQIQNYRPITLLTSSYKVVARLLANRMKKVLGSVISEEQHGFLPGRRLSDAVSTVADVIEAANNDSEDWYLLMVDFQKAFDSVSRTFLFDTMALMGFPVRFIGWCRGLHGGSFTQLLVNGWLGDRVDVCKGVRQGCPLAPYLFLCAVEPICQEAKRRRLGVCTEQGERLAYLGYADDTTLILNGKLQIRGAQKLLDDFGARSGLRVNKEKSALFLVGTNLEKGEDKESGFAWVKPKEAGRLLGVWVSPLGSADVTWDKALARAAEELTKWQSRHLTTTARVAVVNAYVCPILTFQGQVYPPSEKVWKRIMKLLVNFISGNRASVEQHFTLWSRDLIFRPRKEGGLEVRDPFVDICSLAARRVGLLVLDRGGVRKWLAEKAADLPVGFRSFWAHEELLKTWKGRSVRWKQTCELFMKSKVAREESESRWDIAQEPLVFKRRILPNGKKPLGRQKLAEGLELFQLGDFVGTSDDGTCFLKDEKELEKVFGTLKKARRALKVFHCIPDLWKQKLLAPITGAEFLEVTEFVKKKGTVGVWKVDAVVQEGLACRACDCFGEPLVGSAETSAILRLERVEPVMISAGKVIGVGGLPEVRLRCSELCAGGQIPPFKQLRAFFGAQQGAVLQQEKWAEDWGKPIDWRRIIRVRDSGVLPNRARDVMLRLHCRNLQVGVRLKFLEGFLCPHCGAEETAEHCLFDCPRIQLVVHVLLKALRMINPSRKIESLGDLIYQKEGSASGFPEATLTAVALHKVWVERCDAAFERGQFRSRRVLRKIAATFYTHVRVYLRAKKGGKAAGFMLGPGQHSSLERLDPDEFCLLRRICDTSPQLSRLRGPVVSLPSGPTRAHFTAPRKMSGWVRWLVAI